jgi:hypothetical protein
MNDHLTDTIEVRPARPDDERALIRLAQLDSARVPAAPLLLAFADGELRAAISLTTSTVIADPFAHTARLVDVLRAQVAPPQRRPVTLSQFGLIGRGYRLIRSWATT